MADNQIVILTGPDRIRKRPCVVYHSNDVEGAQHAVQSLLDIFAAEAQLGHCKHIAVKQRGEELEISGDDRGIYLGQDTADDRKWKELFCEMFPLPACSPDESGYSFGLIDYAHHALYGETQTSESIYFPEDLGYMDLYALQCVCAQLDVHVNRGGIHSEIRFEHGYNVGGMSSKPTGEQSGTCFRLVLDRDVFTQTVIPERFFFKNLRSLAMLCPGLCCTYESTNGQTETFCYSGGISEFIQRLCSDNTIPVYRNEIKAKGRERYNLAEYKACVDVAVGFTPDAGSITCFHNFRELRNGGLHLDELQKQISRAFNSCFHCDTADNGPFSFDEIAKHLTIVLATWCAPHASVWESGTKQSIRNRMIAEMVHDAAGAEFDNYLHRNKEKYRSLIDRILPDSK